MSHTITDKRAAALEDDEAKEKAREAQSAKLMLATTMTLLSSGMGGVSRAEVEAKRKQMKAQADREMRPYRSERKKKNKSSRKARKANRA